MNTELMVVKRRQPYCRRIPRRAMPVLQSLYASPDRTMGVGSSDGDWNCSPDLVTDLISHQLVAKRGDGCYAITVPGITYCIAREYGISFAYMVYLAYLYAESRDPAYALQIAGGDATLARKMVSGEAEYPYGILYHPNADKKFEAANRFVLGTYIEKEGRYVNGIVTDVARHELSRKGIVRCVPGYLLMVRNETYSRMQKHGQDLQAIVAWAEEVCNAETLARQSGVSTAPFCVAGQSAQET